MTDDKFLTALLGLNLARAANPPCKNPVSPRRKPPGLKRDNPSVVESRCKSAAPMASCVATWAPKWLKNLARITPTESR